MSNFPNQEKVTKQEMSVPTQDKALAYLRRWNVYWTIEGNREPSELKESEEAFGALLSLILASDKGPEVDRAWIRVVIREIAQLFDKETVTERYIILLEMAEKLLKDKLLAAGVTVKED